MAKNYGLLTKIASAAIGAVKNSIGVTTSTTILPSSAYRGSQPGPNRSWMFNQGDSGLDIQFSYTGLEQIKQAYECCPTVFSIINQQAYTFTTGKTVIRNTDGSEAKGKWVDKMKGLLTNPNPLQNWKQFEAQLVIFTRLFGYCAILPIVPKGFNKEDAEALWIIPPYMCEFEFNETIFYNLKKSWIKRIFLKYGPELAELPVDDIILIRDITPGFDNVYLPGTPIKPLQQNITNLIKLAESKGMLISYRGALGILTPEIDPSGAIPAEPKEGDDMQTGLMQLGLLRGQRKIIIANAAMKWQQIGIPYKDLMLTEWAQDEVMIISDGLTFPYKLLSNQVSGSMGGTEIDSWKKKLYVDFTIPYAEMIYEQLSEEFNADENGCVIMKDFSKVKVLQEDDLKNAQARKSRNDALQIEFYNNMLTLNRWLELNGEQPIDKKTGDKYYYELIKMGWEFGKSGVTLQMAEAGTSSTSNEGK